MKKTEQTKIFCHTRDIRMPVSPGRWLGILENVLEKPDKTIKDSPSKRTAKVCLSPWGDVCVAKHEWTMKRKLFSAAQPFRRRIFWNTLLELHRKEVPIATPLLYLEVREGPFVSCSYLVTRWVEGKSLGRMATETHGSSEDDLMEVIKHTTSIASYLHNLGFVHGNLKWSDILIDPSRPLGVVLGDLERVRRSQSFSDHGKDLARFVFSSREHGMSREVADKIVSWYFWEAGYRPDTFDSSLVRQLVRWERKYMGKRFDRL